MTLPNEAAPIAGTAPTNELEALWNRVLGAVADIEHRVSLIEQGGGFANVGNDIVQGSAVVDDISAVFGHLGLGTPKSAVKPAT